MTRLAAPERSLKWTARTYRLNAIRKGAAEAMREACAALELYGRGIAASEDAFSEGYV